MLLTHNPYGWPEVRDQSNKINKHNILIERYEALDCSADKVTALNAYTPCDTNIYISKGKHCSSVPSK